MERSEKACPTCGNWNRADLLVCAHCGASLIVSSKPIKKAPRSEQVAAIDAFFDRWRASKNPVSRVLYLLAKGAWTVYMAIVALIVWAIAMAPG